MNTVSTVWLYDAIHNLGLKPSEELLYSFLLKKAVYTMRDYCPESTTNFEGKIDWGLMNEEFEDYSIITHCVSQQNDFQQYIEKNLGISRPSFYRTLSSLQEKDLLYSADYNFIKSVTPTINLFEDQFKELKDSKCYILSIDFDLLDGSKYQTIFLERDLLSKPKLMYFYSWMLQRYTYWKRQGKRFMTSADRLAEEYDVTLSLFKKMVSELKALGYILKDYKKEWVVIG